MIDKNNVDIERKRMLIVPGHPQKHLRRESFSLDNENNDHYRHTCRSIITNKPKEEEGKKQKQFASSLALFLFIEILTTTYIPIAIFFSFAYPGLYCCLDSLPI